jgi:hypothetical protein
MGSSSGGGGGGIETFGARSLGVSSAVTSSRDLFRDGLLPAVRPEEVEGPKVFIWFTPDEKPFVNGGRELTPGDDPGSR